MALSGNICQKIGRRQITDKAATSFQRTSQVTPALIRRIGLETELKGHNGCVNCLEWNHKGNLLASGSDDVQIILWDPFRHKTLSTIRTGHTGNIFSVKFLPNSNDSLIVSGAADCKIRVHDINAQEATQVFSCHVGRVKRLATAPNVPFMFWSAAEDGTIMQYDLRSPETSQSGNPSNVLINLNAHLGAAAEAKCLAINPLRPEMLAVGANDPYVRIYDRRMLNTRSIRFPAESAQSRLYQWERPSLDPEVMCTENYSLPQDAVNYYIAGHLPQKQQDYRKKYRTLASTYLTFSPDGSELLVNLGGEQIYLFDVNAANSPPKFTMPSVPPHSNGVVKECSGRHGNGLHHCNGTTTNGVSKQLATPPPSSAASKTEKSKHRKKLKHSRPLPPTVDAIKQRANSVFEKQRYNQAILLYNQAIAMVPDSPILYGNRAAAYMKRNWDGDYYAALKDCYSALRLDADHLKANFRMAKCLYELSWTREAFDCLQMFMTKFPDYASSASCQQLDKDIRAAIYSHTPEESRSSPGAARGGGAPTQDTLSDQEKKWRDAANDYKQRFCGHCNTTTDIKEANYFGSNGQYIVAGSDDGSFFIWEKATTNIVRVLRGDEAIVNCLQPHPTSCLLATSGIDPLVRLWSPRPEDGQKDEREVDDSDDAAAANQKRMNADPLEVMLMNMGYRITGVLDDDDEEGGGGGGGIGRAAGAGDGGEGPVHCRPS